MKPANPAAARWAVLVTFIAHGLLIGVWAPHVALAKERLNAGPAEFGLALLSIAGGAVVAMPSAGALINRFGSARATLVTGILFCLTFFGPLSAQTLLQFVIGGFAMGASIGSMDVSMNSHGLAVEKAFKQPVMSQFHGGFSLGCLVGALGGGWLLHEFGPRTQALIAVITCLVLILAASRFYLPNEVDKGQSGNHFALPNRATVGIGLLAFLALMIEGSILDWAAIMMRERFLIEASFAAFGFGFYQGGMTVSRFLGDALRLRFGAVRLVFTSALLAALGTTAALVAPVPSLVIAAFVVAGVGIGNITPVLFAGGGRLEPEAPGHGIAAVTTLGYAGFLCGPPLIGFAAHFTSLSWALGLTVLAAIVIAMFAGKVDAADRF